jgi:hypothetical protein
MEMMNMPLDYINALYNIAIERQKEDMKRREEAKEKGEEPGLSEAEAIELEDEMEGAFT